MQGSRPDRIVIDDPFFVDPRTILTGMNYQWVNKTMFGRPSDEYRVMKEKGWRDVPADRHPDDTRRTREGTIEFGNCILMFRSNELTAEAMELAEDQATEQADMHDAGPKTGGRVVVIEVPVFVPFISGPTKSVRARANNTVRNMLEGIWRGKILLPHPSGCFHFASEREPRHWSLRWLFNLISKQETDHG